MLGVLPPAAVALLMLPIESLYSQTVMVGSFLALGSFFFSMRNPDFLKRVAPSLDTSTGIKFSNEASVQRILANLDQLMEKEELYLDENLNLSDLAVRLNIQAYRFSEILDHKLNTSYKSYINNLRLVKAMDLLIREPESSILDIAFRSGFRSKSAFNNFFKNNTGITPRDYRRSQGESTVIPARPHRFSR